MLIEQAFQKYLQKVEKNGRNDNISTERGRFVTIYNESQNKYIEYILDRKSNDDIRHIQSLLITDKKLSDPQKVRNHYNFKFPPNYFDLSNVYALGSKGKCKNKEIYLFEAKEENKNELLQDEYHKPSFFWRETFYILATDTLNVYYDDFTIENLILSYYRKPVQIALLDPENPETTFNETIQMDFPDYVQDRIISLCAGEFSLNENDPIFQAQKQRVVSKL